MKKIIYAISWDDYQLGYGATPSHYSIHLTKEDREIYFDKTIMEGDKSNSTDPTGFFTLYATDAPKKLLSRLYYEKTLEVDYKFW
jgi:hypothetical protein